MPLTRGQKINEFFEWVYTGKTGSENLVQQAKKGDTLVDDLSILLPGGGQKPNSFFVFDKLDNGNVYGHFEHEGKRIPHIRSRQHIRKRPQRKRKRPNKRQRKNKKKRTSGPASATAVASTNPEPSNTTSIDPEVSFDVPEGVVSTSTAGMVSASDSASGPPSATAVAPTNPEPSDATSITTSGPTDAPCTSTDASVNRSSPDTPEPTGPTASTDPTFNPPENLFFDQSVGRNYRKRYSRKAKQEVELPLTQQQFDVCEAGPYPEEEIGRNEEGQKFIYMVRAFRDQDCGRSRYRYEGRSQGSRTKERLFVRWLTNNHMDRAWRNRTIMSHVGYWFPIPVAGTVDQRKALCTVASVAKTLEYMGLFQKMNDFLSASDFVRKPFRQVVRALQSIKGFAQHTIKNPATTFDPVLHCRHGQLYLLQIRSKKKTTPLHR